MDKILPSLRINERTATWLSYTIVSVMVVCAMVIAVRFGQALIPTWHGSYLVLLGLLVIWETFYTQQIRKNLTVLAQEWLLFYLAELVVLMLLLKIFQLVAGGIDTVFSQFAAMQQDFVSSFFNSEYLLSLLSLLVIWIVCLSFSSPLEVLRVSQQNLQIEQDIGGYTERSAARQQIVDQVLLIGLVMVVMASLTRSDRTASWFSAPGTRMDVIIIMVYFMLGLVLLSLTQFSVMQMRWAVNRIPTSRRLASNWAFFGLLFLAVVVSVSLLLPTHYAVGLLTLLNIMVGIVLDVIQLLTWLILAMVMLLAQFFGLLSGESQQIEINPPAPMPTPYSSAEISDYNLDIVEWIGSILFWLVIGILVIYLLVYFFQVRRQDISRMARLPLFSMLIAWWRNLRGWIKGIGKRASQTILAGVQRLRLVPRIPIVSPSIGYTSLRRMTARQRVIFYYLALVRRGSESGSPRDPSQTPNEYASRLAGAFKNDPSGVDETVQRDLWSITDRFIEARYSRHDIDNGQVSLVRQSWLRLKTALRRIRLTGRNR